MELDGTQIKHQTHQRQRPTASPYPPWDPPPHNTTLQTATRALVFSCWLPVIFHVLLCVNNSTMTDEFPTPMEIKALAEGKHIIFGQ
jgi:hypothetical protein